MKKGLIEFLDNVGNIEYVHIDYKFARAIQRIEKSGTGGLD